MLMIKVECLPVASNWDPLSYPNPKCVNEKALFTAGLATDVITDGLFPILKY